MFRAEKWLLTYSRRYPDCWRVFESMRLARKELLPSWPEWCFVPIAGAFNVTENPLEVGIISALAAWRMTKGIYRFDPDIFEAVWETPINGDIPGELLKHLPEWCVYIETPNKHVFGELYGFFAHLEYDVKNGDEELRLLLDHDLALISIPVHLGGGLYEGIEKTILQAGNGIEISTKEIKQVEQMVEPLVALTLYLCSEAPDISGRVPGVSPSYPQAKRTKRGPRLFAAPGVRLYQVGEKLGQQLRQARTAAKRSHASPTPHIRRAHWHLYWTGPRSSRQTPVLKWLPPIPVGFKD